jgi:arylsulfatase A-like enzyme
MITETRRTAIGALAGAVAFAASASKRPNFVVIASPIPNIQSIAAEGLQFNNAFVTTPVELPSTISILTGRYVHSHRVATNGDYAALTPRLKTFQRLLQDAGYSISNREIPGAEPFSLFTGGKGGQLLDALQQRGQVDRTVVIITSACGNPARSSRDESIRVPLFIRYPKLIKPGRTTDAFALNIDLAPTILELAGIRLPNNMHGRSLVPQMKGKTKNTRQAFLIEYFADPTFPEQSTWVGVRTEKWKYTRYVDLEGKDELYDLESDPNEKKNVINDPQGREALALLRPELQSFLRMTF